MGPPVAIVCVGMAGSGKTTFMQRINSYLHSQNTPPYVINLDPAVRNVPFESNIDIRDSVNYKEVMKQYNLGPNGGILTSLNLFATKIDQILSILEKRTLPKPSPTTTSSSASPTTPAAPTPTQKPTSHILLDTPGQIEVFVWSASGSILLSSLASTFPTVLAYIIDTPRTTASTGTFMSNMLYACSILYKTKLPMILVWNKTDVKSEEVGIEWMTDFEAFQAALREEDEQGEGGAGSGYMGSLLNSMSLMLEEFYRHLSVVGVSSMTGRGVKEFFEAVGEKAVEFERDYRPELERRRRLQVEEKEKRREKELARLMKDVSVAGSGGAAMGKGKGRRAEPETISDIEDENGEGDVPAEMVEPDDVEMEEEDAEAELTRIYADALGKGDGEEPGFVKYLKASQVGP